MCRITIDVRSAIERVAHGAHLVLECKEHLAAAQIRDVLEAVLVLVAFFADKSALEKAAIRTGEIGKINGNVVAVEWRLRSWCFTEYEMLRGANRNAHMRLPTNLPDDR